MRLWFPPGSLYSPFCPHAVALLLAQQTRMPDTIIYIYMSRYLEYVFITSHEHILVYTKDYFFVCCYASFTTLPPPLPHQNSAFYSFFCVIVLLSIFFFQKLGKCGVQMCMRRQHAWLQPRSLCKHTVYTVFHVVQRAQTARTRRMAKRLRARAIVYRE